VASSRRRPLPLPHRRSPAAELSRRRDGAMRSAAFEHMYEG
jgi:hypothetical protein